MPFTPKLIRTLAALSTLGLAAAHPARAQTPITGTGYNADVVLEDAGSSANYSTFFGNDTTYGWIEDGLKSQSGLPREGGQNLTATTISAATNTVTGGNTTFLFQPYAVDQNTNNGSALNVLQETDGSGTTFTLTTPTAFSSLALDAASTVATGSSQGHLVLNFVGGLSSGNINYNAFDWYNHGSHPSTQVLASDVSRGEAGYNSNSSNTVIDTAHANSFNLYETDINLASLGYGSSVLQSITFYKASDAGGTGVFGISGVSDTSAAPEPSPLAGIAFTGLGVLGLLWKARKRLAPSV